MDISPVFHVRPLRGLSTLLALYPRSLGAVRSCFASTSRRLDDLGSFKVWPLRGQCSPRCSSPRSLGAVRSRLASDVGLVWSDIVSLWRWYGLTSCRCGVGMVWHRVVVALVWSDIVSLWRWYGLTSCRSCVDLALTPEGSHHEWPQVVERAWWCSEASHYDRERPGVAGWQSGKTSERSHVVSRTYHPVGYATCLPLSDITVVLPRLILFLPAKNRRV